MAFETDQNPVTAHDIRDRARALAPAIRARTHETETLRRLPWASVEEILASGIGRVQRPARWGGYELGFEAAFDVAAEIGRACGSTAWSVSFLNHHDWLLGQFEEQAQADVWADDRDARVASAFAPGGRARPVDGGWVLQGNWPWASGIDHCNWTIVAAVDPAQPGPPSPRLFLLPETDFTIEDTWFNVGLRGSGSNNVVIAEETFVPAHRTVELFALREGTAPGGQVNASAPFRTPMMAAFGLGLLGPALGVARGALEEWRDWTKERTSTYTFEQVAQQTPMQISLGQATAHVDAAELLLRDNLRRLADPEAITEVERTTNRRNCAYAAQLLTRTMDELLQLSGARGLFDTNSVQRAWRDVHAIACHTGLNPNSVYEAHGRLELALGRNPKDPLY
ncbi:Flavin-dependent monooxygenase, oxygenase subunit HsaA [Baekduia alba]|uniref:acyl-CoA dehydrogenase family protein n=1 Tax=Baekduia alba TaxID=2997333 RepID=UPI0023401BA5|nr:acyl-CoA dehydrogenase family protein [Baekduia alba]WCB95274.1 Flavin-dependent monooxygenase, oxygenase subunit HsaA [Baekduia alba]